MELTIQDMIKVFENASVNAKCKPACTNQAVKFSE